MTRLRHYLRRAASLPPHLIALKIIIIGWRGIQNAWERQRDLRLPTFLALSRVPQGSLFSYFKSVSPEFLQPRAEQIATLVKLTRTHYFDLLGSGWVQVKHGMRCMGLEGHRYEMGAAVAPDPDGRWLAGRINRANLPEAQRIWQMIDANYRAIDWHLDFKSGYRWAEAMWFADVPYGHRPGVDIKVPWELARMQHLPWLVWGYLLASIREEDFESPDIYIREFRSQVLDFIACNPPRLGVNWRTPMDVAIRAANWLVSYDLFRAQGVEFDAGFEAELARSLFQHGTHIIRHLEWFPEGRGNHYLSDIVGLLIIAAYLPCSPDTDAWLVFAVQELAGEVDYQFNPDGSNFEGSTSYHRLAAELVTYGVALTLGLPPEKQAVLARRDRHRLSTRPALRPGPISLYPLPGSGRLTPFPPTLLERLEKAAEFTLHITRPDGAVAQFGDNDSGRFLKLLPSVRMRRVQEAKSFYVNLADYDALPDESNYPDENILDHRHLVASIGGLFGRDDLLASARGWELETYLIRQLAGDTIASYQANSVPSDTIITYPRSKKQFISLQKAQAALPKSQQDRLEIPIEGGGLLEGLEVASYPDFGLYLYRSRRLWLAIRCGSIGQNGNGGHTHNDQLSIELCLDGKALVTDPGTYLYTPLPGRRNQYRSVRAHFAPRLVGNEPWDMDAGLFELKGRSEAQCLYFTPEGFAGILSMPGGNVTRRLELWDEKILIVDTTDRAPAIPLADASVFPPQSTVPLSNGYGKQLAERRHSSAGEIRGY